MPKNCNQVVQVIHNSVRGRARFRVKGLTQSKGLKTYLQHQLSAKKEINSFSVSTLTGNVLVFYDKDYSATIIASSVEELILSYNVEDEHIELDIPKLNIKSKHQPKKICKNNPLTSLKEQAINPWHTLDIDTISDMLETSKESGLAEAKACTYLNTYGPNLLPDTKKRSALAIFLGQFNSLPVYLLGVAATVSLFTGGLLDAIVIGSVVLINSVIGYVTESQAEKTINSLKTMVRPLARVLRNGNLIDCSSESVVPGDLLVLRPGSFVAADARITDSNYLSVDESALTGESLPVSKRNRVINDIDIAVADRTNMVYMGTMVTGGQGLAIVVATGRYTEIGQIQALVGQADTPQTPLERQLNIVGNQLVLISSAICTLVFGIGYLRGYGLLEMFKMALSLAVAAVPEGLPAVATTTLAIGINKLKAQKILIRRLDAVEVLGSCQTICFDKTGTITYNKMTVVAAFTGKTRINLSENKEALRSNINEDNELRLLLDVCALCNETTVTMQDDEYITFGSPTESALVQIGLSLGLDVLSTRQNYPIIKINHRTEERNYMSTIHPCSDTHKWQQVDKAPANGANKLAAIKGSPLEVLAMCSFAIHNGRLEVLDDDFRHIIEDENERMAAKALRVLGVSYCYVNDGEDNLPENPTNIVWLGLIGMIDPIRKGMKDLVSSFHKAGIETVMITGDQSLTAYAIGKELNLSAGKQIEILDSRHLKNLDAEVLKTLCAQIHVFSRVSPAHKYEIVKALQSTGKVVAMTGDGINDGPALKAADIGVTIGQGGTDLAREVADVILEDDDLSTMLDAISNGRTIYSNIRKSIRFLLATNMSEIVVMFTTLTGGLGHPLNTMQLLWINLVSDIFPGLALSLEPPERDVLSRPPRNPQEQILKPTDMKKLVIESSVISAGAISAYGYGLLNYGASPQANTLAFLSLTFAQLIHTFSCRSETLSIYDKEKLARNKYLDTAMAGSFLLQFACLFVPALRRLLGITPINFKDYLVIAGSSVLPFLINEKIKKIGDSKL
ncbi:MAG: cation-transporting P-type ATPase [Candidatus Magnetoovum sp. WYHC-5]|nr:cation-transporting P-type ATPase [Candidatus Magnetoovum sp. WYHC-5]